MPSSYPRSPKLLKGALIEFSERFLGPIPNIIVFQYNPEFLTRTLSPWTPPASASVGGISNGADQTASMRQEASTPPCQAQPHDPPETFSLPLELDATDALEFPETHPAARISGVTDRIAALEMLLYPQEEGGLLGSLMGSLSASVSVGGSGISLGGSAGGKVGETKRATSPVVLFVWGPGRIFPVRLESFQVEEQAYSPLLYPIRAKVTVGLKVLGPECFPSKNRKFSEELAVKSYQFTKKQKQVWAAANLANSVESMLGMMPF